MITKEEDKLSVDTVTERNSNNVIKNNDTDTVEHACPECGTTVNSKGEPLTERGLKGHRMKAHGVPWTGERKTGEDEGESPQRSDVKPDKKRRKATSKKTTYEPVLEESGVPDALLLLRNQLRLYGLSARDSDAVTDFMKSYEVDDLLALNKALTSVGMARSKKTLFLESWVNAREIDLTYDLQEELGLFREASTQKYDRYGMRLRSRRNDYGEDSMSDFDRKIDGDIDRERKLKLLERLRGESTEEGEELSESSPFAEDLITRAKEAEKKAEDLQKQNAELKEQKLKLELEAQFNQKFKEWEEKHSITDESTLLLKRIDSGLARMGDVTERAIGMYIGDEIKKKPPDRKKIGGESGLISLIPQEMLEE